MPPGRRNAHADFDPADPIHHPLLPRYRRGRAMFGMLLVLAESQRELIIAGIRNGVAAARARGRTSRS
ncbi:recombinase family protein [Nocardia sp. NPDC101769]|uniref:recombinase family protein n=1 Tax=Nocardia sp. NPDC101769 TaxID=3364333 RepID=UPI003828FCF1